MLAPVRSPEEPEVHVHGAVREVQQQVLADRLGTRERGAVDRLRGEKAALRRRHTHDCAGEVALEIPSQGMKGVTLRHRTHRDAARRSGHAIVQSGGSTSAPPT
jgi:hypothetical protein